MSEPTKVTNLAKAADSLSLGISMVVAVIIGVAIGLGLKKLSGSNWGLGIGVAIGVLAAFNNVYKAYKSQQKSYDELNSRPKILRDDEDEI